MITDLTADERKAIKSLKKLEQSWPKSLWLFSASGTLTVMRCGEDGETVTRRNGSVDPDYIVDWINIPNDGGDW